jgi:hypothetical protein
MKRKKRLLHNVLRVGSAIPALARPRRAAARSTGVNCSSKTPVGIGVAGVASAHQQGLLFFLLIGAQKSSLALFGSRGPCVTCRVRCRYHVLVTENMRWLA